MSAALLPSCGNSFKTPSAIHASFPGGLAVWADRTGRELEDPWAAIWASLPSPRALRETWAVALALPHHRTCRAGGPELTSSSQELLSQEVLVRGLVAQLCGLHLRDTLQRVMQALVDTVSLFRSLGARDSSPLCEVTMLLCSDPLAPRWSPKDMSVLGGIGQHQKCVQLFAGRPNCLEARVV